MALIARGTSFIGYKANNPQIQRIIRDPYSSVMLIDVREPHETSAGTIPTAFTLPLSSNPDALLLQPDEFAARFGFAKPPITKELVFYCKAGVRSSAAAQIAKQGGYEKVGEYRGSWLDWQRKGGTTSKGEHAPHRKELGDGWEKVGGAD